MSTSTFAVKFLAGKRALVTGVDEAGQNQQAVLDATKYLELVQMDREFEAKERFDEAVKAYFAALTEAADELKAATAEALDPAFNILISSGNHEDRTEDEYFVLDTNSAIINLIVNEETDRLVWVGSSIEILAYEGDDVAVEATTVDDLAAFGVNTSIGG